MRSWAGLVILSAALAGCGGTGTGASLRCDMSGTSDSTVESCHAGLEIRRAERRARDTAARRCDHDDDVQACYRAAQYDEREDREAAATVGRYQRACMEGVFDACFRVAGYWERGRGVGADAGRATQLLAQACSGGHGGACGALAQRTRPRREQLALEQRACELGDWPSCQLLGEAYWRGVGVAVDLVLARSWLGRACQGGRGEACVALGQLDSEAVAPRGAGGGCC